MDGSRDLYSSHWQPQTTLVRGGLHRSPHQETSEALYMTSGFVYDTAE
jgi:O-succinylhomoserine sulfhydrylase